MPIAISIAIIVYIAVWGFINARVDRIEDPETKKRLKHIADNPIMYFVFYAVILVLINGIFGWF